jgi:hypothetical protein
MIRKSNRSHYDSNGWLFASSNLNLFDTRMRLNLIQLVLNRFLHLDPITQLSSQACPFAVNYNSEVSLNIFFTLFKLVSLVLRGLRKEF